MIFDGIDFPKDFDGAFFDPPYSLTQVSRSYEDMGKLFYSKDNPTGAYSNVKDQIAWRIKPGGYVISFGWNTTGMGKKRGFKIMEILIVCHGGNHNDTLVTVERRMNRRLLPQTNKEVIR